MIKARRAILSVVLMGGFVVHGAGAAHVARGAPPSPRLGLFGVEIGGPEDGFAITDLAAFESAKRVGARSVDLRPIWSVLEPQPGVYDWSTLDAALDNAEAVDLPVTITVRFFDDQVPAWLNDENMVDQDGRPFSGYGFKGQHRSPSYWGPDARASYLRIVEELVRRYRKNPRILAWQFFYGYNDSFYMGMWNGLQTVYDYSAFSQEQYRRYLRHEKDLRLSEVNARYGTHYRRWDDVTQPKPTFGTLNVSLVWHDFQDYRMWTIEETFDAIDRTVRRLDRRPLIMYYGGSFHHAAHQLSVYDIGLRLLKKYGGMLDVTCFEDPVPAELGTGIVRSYGVTPMGEAWQVPPPLKDFRRLFFHAFSLGVDSYQLVGSWEKMETSPEEFRRMAEVFAELRGASPVRAPTAGLVSYRSIMSNIPARPYINPTLALIPKLQEYQYSLDWHSDMSPLGDLGRYSALLDANSEVLERRVIERLGEYVESGGRLALLPRSGRYALEDGEPDFPLLERLHCPDPGSQHTQDWVFGKGRVFRIGTEMDWASPEGAAALLKTMEWLRVERPITATPGLLAAVSRGDQGVFYVVLFHPKAEPANATVSVRPGLLEPERTYEYVNLLDPQRAAQSVTATSIETGITLSFSPNELKVLKLGPAHGNK